MDTRRVRDEELQLHDDDLSLHQPQHQPQPQQQSQHDVHVNAAIGTAPHTVNVDAVAGLPSPAVVLAPLQQARERWLKPAELQALLLHARASQGYWRVRGQSEYVLPLLSTGPPTRPRPGSVYLFSKANVQRWRNDRYQWIGTDRHNKSVNSLSQLACAAAAGVCSTLTPRMIVYVFSLKVNGTDALTCYYAKCAESAAAPAASLDSSAAHASSSGEAYLGAVGSFQRRGYCLLRDTDLVLVHYLDNCGKGGGSSSCTLASAAPPAISASSESVAIDLTLYLPYFALQPNDDLSAAAAYVWQTPLLQSCAPAAAPSSPVTSVSLQVLDFSPSSDCVDGGGKLLVCMSWPAAYAATSSSRPALFAHFVRAQANSPPISVASLALERLGSSDSYRTSLPAVSQVGAHYAWYVSDRERHGAVGASVSPLMPFEFRARESIGSAAAPSLPPLRSRSRSQLRMPRSPSASPSLSPLPFLAVPHARSHSQSSLVSPSSAVASAPPLSSLPEHSLERDFIVSLLERVQSLEKSVLASSSALSLADVQSCILDSPGEDLIESLLLCAMHKIVAQCKSVGAAISEQLRAAAGERDAQGRQLVHYAAGLGYTALLSMLMSQLRVDVNSRDVRGRTPLHYAALSDAEGDAEAAPAALTVSALLSFGADDRLLDDDGSSALALADQQGRSHVVQVFLEVQNAELGMDDDEAPASRASSHRHGQAASAIAASSAAAAAPAASSSAHDSAHMLSASEDDTDDDGSMYDTSAFTAPIPSALDSHMARSAATAASPSAAASASASTAAPTSSTVSDDVSPATAPSMFPLDRAFSSLTLHDMGISAHALAAFNAPNDANGFFASDTAHFAGVVRKVQRQIRWWLFRRHMAANKLQSLARGMLARRSLKRLRESAVAIQSVFRTRKVRKEFVQLKKVTLILQEKFRTTREGKHGGATSPPLLSSSAAGMHAHSDMLQPPTLMRPLSTGELSAHAGSGSGGDSASERDDGDVKRPRTQQDLLSPLPLDTGRPHSGMSFRFTPDPTAAPSSFDLPSHAALSSDHPLSSMLLSDASTESASHSANLHGVFMPLHFPVEDACLADAQSMQVS